MVSIRAVDFADQEAIRLRAAMAAELQERYADYPADYGHAQRPTAEQFRDGNGTYVLAVEGERPVGIGGIRVRDAGVGEVKNVYVDPARRGAGTAGMIMDVLEAWALEAGCERLILETGERQPEALALYARRGYTRIPAYPPWDDELSICMEKHLVRTTQR